MLSKDANIRFALRKMCSEEKVKDVSNLLLVPQKYQKNQSLQSRRGAFEKIEVCDSWSFLAITVEARNKDRIT